MTLHSIQKAPLFLKACTSCRANSSEAERETTLAIESEGQGGAPIAVFTNAIGEEKVVDLTELRDVMRALNFTRCAQHSHTLPFAASLTCIRDKPHLGTLSPPSVLEYCTAALQDQQWLAVRFSGLQAALNPVAMLDNETGNLLRYHASAGPRSELPGPLACAQLSLLNPPKPLAFSGDGCSEAEWVTVHELLNPQYT